MIAATPSLACEPLRQAYAGRRVLVTGHTGFKGAWLCETLLGLGATVCGLSLPPDGTRRLFDALNLGERLQHLELDVADAQGVHETLQSFAPEYVFHLAAQPLVRASYLAPRQTFQTNVMGTVSVLEALRHAQGEVAALFITSDKCYRSQEWVYGHREIDPLGGNDPYSASKAAAEIAIHSYLQSYFHGENPRIRLASARAGNVIGGGDWAQDRIIPDCVRATEAGQPVRLRNPHAVRPWQHVLEVVFAYLYLGAALHGTPFPGVDRAKLNSAFNFGPMTEATQSVQNLVAMFCECYSGTWEMEGTPSAMKETDYLHLCIDKASSTLRWRPVWDFATSVRTTADFYSVLRGKSPQPVAQIRQQINQYISDAQALSAPWSL